MYIVKVLKRKDAASVVVAVTLAFQLQQLLGVPTYRLSNWLANIGGNGGDTAYNNPSGGWRNEILNPIVSFIVQMIVLELLIRLFVWLHPMFVSKKR